MSRVLSRVIICLGRLSPAASSDQPEAGGPRHRFCSVLLRMGFTEPPLLPGERWSLTPPFHPYRPKPAVSFCCTFLGVASTGRYPASCPVKPGLSSSAAFRHIQPRLSVLLNTDFYYTIFRRLRQRSDHLRMCQVIVGTFSYLLMSVYFFYFQIILPALLSPTFISFSRRLFQRLFSMLSALHPEVAYDV